VWCSRRRVASLGPVFVGDWGLGWFLSPFERRPRSRFRSRARYLPRTRYLSRSRYRSCSRSRSCSCSCSRSRSHSRSRSRFCSRSHARARARSHSRAVLVGRCSRTSDRRRPRRVRAEVGQSPLSSSVSSVDDTHRRSTWEDRAGGVGGRGWAGYTLITRQSRALCPTRCTRTRVVVVVVRASTLGVELGGRPTGTSHRSPPPARGFGI